jgi:predicted DNA-binding protein
MSFKATSLRLPPELAEELAGVARVDGVPVSEIVRAAIYEYIAARRIHPEFKERLRRCMEEDRKALERLAE